MTSKAKVKPIASTIKYDPKQQALFAGGRDWYLDDYTPVKQSDIASVYNQIARVCGDSVNSEQITVSLVSLFTSGDDDKITEQFIMRALTNLSAAAKRALALAQTLALASGVSDYNDECTDDLSALAGEHQTVLARIAEIDSALSEHKLALSKRIGITTLQIGWAPNDGRFYVDESTLKARSNVGTIARDYSARKWAKTFQALKGVAGPVVGKLAIPDGSPTPDNNGKGSKFTCSLTPPSGKAYTSESNSPTGAGKGAMVSMCKAEINVDVSSKAWGVPAAFGVPVKSASEDATSE